MLSTNKQTDKQTKQSYQKHNLLCQPGNDSHKLVDAVLVASTIGGVVSILSSCTSYSRSLLLLTMNYKRITYMYIRTQMYVKRETQHTYVTLLCHYSLSCESCNKTCITKHCNYFDLSHIAVCVCGVHC